MHLLILNDRAFLLHLEQSVLLGLDRAFLLGQDRLELLRLQIQLVDIGLALPAANDGEESVRL